MLNIPQADIRVIAPDVGGGFGYKCLLQPEEVCVAWLALTRKTPFRWIEDRREHLVAGANARQHHYRLTAYADERGRLLGLDAEVIGRYRRLFGLAVHRLSGGSAGRRQSARAV